MKIKNIKVDDIIQVFNYKTFNEYNLELYKVLNIYKSENNIKVFECKRAKLNKNKELEVFTNHTKLIHESDVMSIYKEIDR